MTSHSNRNNKIYFSASLQGEKHRDPKFGYKLVQHMKNKGYEVLSEHVAARNKNEQDNIFLEKTGIDRRDPNLKEPWMSAYKIDMNWVDLTNFLIAVVDGPSHGVGMEIMRALLKEERGLEKTEILCLVHVDNLNTLSWMIRGVPKRYKNFHIKTYTNFDTAVVAIDSFLKSSIMS